MNWVCVVVWLSLVSVSPLFGVSLAGAQSLPVVINEVLYDPAGGDGGQEFVELFNVGWAPVGLEGWTLETGNGSYPDRWTLEWTGTVKDTIGPQGFFVIGEDGVLPRPDVVTSLDLQNGPDACRLSDASGRYDVAGWGNLSFDEYFEGEPAADVGSGSSIGRDPDGCDTGSNLADFRALDTPSPADYNHPPTDLTPVALGRARYTLATLPEISLVCRIENAGTEACGNGAVVAASLGGCSESLAVLEDIEPAGSMQVMLRVASPGPGLHQAVAWVAYTEDRWSANDTVLASVVVPPPPLVVNEIMFQPGGRDCEWIEILNRGAGPVNLKGWTLEDSKGNPRALADGDLELTSGAFLVLVEDEDVFRILHPEVSTASVHRPSGGWSALNDADGPLGFADATVVRDPCGTMVDSVTYAECWTDPGTSVERIDPAAPSACPANWSPHYGKSTGSPGAANSVSFHLPPPGKVLTLSSRTFSPDGDGAQDLVAVSVALPGAGLVRLTVFDVNGRLVRRLIDGETVDSGRVTFWDGSRDGGAEARTGIYLVMFEARMHVSGETLAARSPLILVRR